MKPAILKSKIFLTLATLIVLIWACFLAFGIWIGFTASSDPSTDTTTSHTYTSEELGIEFLFPKNYTLNVRHDSYQGTEIHVVTIINASTTVPDMSEGPTAISIIELPVTLTSTLEAWVRENSISNFYLSPDQTFEPVTVGGEVALAYRFSGLYEFDAVALQHKGKIYLLSASWMDASDRIRSDFKNLLSSVTFLE